MWANTTSILKGDPTEETGRGSAPENHTSLGGSTAEAMDLSGKSAPTFRWTPDAVRRLDEDVEWALTSNPTGAADVAGVLLGKIGPTIEITGCRPVFLMQPPDHPYALAGPGRREFERTIAAFESSPRVIGFYRSHTGTELDLTEEDLGLVRACFPDTSPIVLLIQRTVNGPSSAKLFLGDQGKVLYHFHSSEDPSALPRWLELWHSLSADSAQATAGSNTATLANTTEPAQTLEPIHSSAEYTPILAPDEVPENSVARERHFNRSPVFLLGVAVVLAVLLAYVVLKGSAKVKEGLASSSPAARDSQSASSQSAGLALRAERHGDDLRLDWNRAAPVLAGATGGMLTIREGNGRERQVMLDGNLLRTGAVVYRPVHGDVSLRLVIFGQEGAKMGESVSSYPQHMSAGGSDGYKEKQ